MGTVAGIVDSRGTVLMEPMRDAALRLTFHEVTLEKEDENPFKNWEKYSKTTWSSTEPITLHKQVKYQLEPGDQQERSKKLTKWTEVTKGHLTAATTHFQPSVT